MERARNTWSQSVFDVEETIDGFIFALGGGGGELDLGGDSLSLVQCVATLSNSTKHKQNLKISNDENRAQNFITRCWNN